ncbi:MAG TPA: MMPL family transporter [Myxococcota bacterium]|nr:MMPL family transporter [Myxococcota bacterium]
MKTLARWMINRSNAWMVVIGVAILAALAGLQVGKIEHDDNILAFLPQDNPDVEAFNRANRLFGSLDLALVGIETDDIFNPDFISRLRRVTKDLKETRGINHVLTLSNVVDFTPDTEHGGVVTTPLIPSAPETTEQLVALRAKVMSRDHLVGHLVSSDGKAVLLYCFLAYGSDPRDMAGAISKVVNDAFPGQRKYWGGGPFVSTYIYDATQRDIHRLTPWAVLAIIIIMTLAFRDIIGVGLVLLSTALGTLLSLGLMAFCGVRFNIVLGSMPVILFAVGSAYGIHVLARYYRLAKNYDLTTALTRTIVGIGPVVLAAGLTTAAGLLSFLSMDIKPLRTFGLFTAIGILATLGLSLTFIPAVICLGRMKRKAAASRFLREPTRRMCVYAQTHRLPVGVALLVVGLFSATMVGRVRTTMDSASFFCEGSPPDLAEKFLGRHFGGSHFIQIHVQGDMQDPSVLREIRRLGDRISLIAHVTDVTHIGTAIAQANQAFVGRERIPDTRAQVALLHCLLSSDPAVEQLITRDRRQALVQITVDTDRAEDLEGLLANIEQIVADKFITRYSIVAALEHSGQADARRLDLISLHIQALAREFHVRMPAAGVERLQSLLKQAGVKADAALVRLRLERLLRSDECAVDLVTLDESLVPKVASALVSLGPAPSDERILAALRPVLMGVAQGENAELADDLSLSIAVPLRGYWKEEAAAERAKSLVAKAGLRRPSGAEGDRFISAVQMSMLDLDSPTIMLPAAAGPKASTLTAYVTGLPVMHRGLSASATSNQVKSLILALVLVILIMTFYSRSFLGGLLVASPTMLTLLVIYGGMGLIGVRLDIGTAMLASLILGAGVDYAVHLVSSWEAPAGAPLREAASRAAERSGPSIWTNAITVALGFFVLTLGEAKPLKNVGGLTAAAMIVAALATFLAIPILARRRCYRQRESTSETTDTKVVKKVLGKASR